MSGKKRVLFFCSASKEIDPKFNQAARNIIRAACLRGYEIVSGGTVKGTMGVIGEEAAACGGYHIGVLPKFMKGMECPTLDETHWMDTMSARKEKMREGVTHVIALPGGIGTLDELIETLVLVKLHRMEARIMAFDLDGFYQPLRNLLDHYVATGMMTQEDRNIISFPKTVEELMEKID